LQNDTAPANNFAYFVPVAVIAVALFVVSVSAVFIGYTVFGNDKTIIVQADNSEDANDDFEVEKNEKDSTSTPAPTPKPEKTTAANAAADNSSLTDSPEAANSVMNADLPSGKNIWK
jgi:hypothetical protein